MLNPSESPQNAVRPKGTGAASAMASRCEEIQPLKPIRGCLPLDFSTLLSFISRDGNGHLQGNPAFVRSSGFDKEQCTPASKPSLNHFHPRAD